MIVVVMSSLDLFQVLKCPSSLAASIVEYREDSMVHFGSVSDVPNSKWAFERRLCSFTKLGPKMPKDTLRLY